MKTLIVTSILALSLNPVAAFAGGDDEYVEADPYPGDLTPTAPPVGGILGGGTGTGGHGSSASTTGAQKTAAGKQNAKSQKENRKKEKKRGPFDWLFALFVPEVEVINKAADTTQVVANTLKDMGKIQKTENSTKEQSKSITVDPRTGVTTTTVTTFECDSSTWTVGADMTPGPTCLDLKMKQFVDPADGQKKMEIRLVEYKATYAGPNAGVPVDSEGYYHQEGSQITFVAANDQEIDDFIYGMKNL